MKKIFVLIIAVSLTLLFTVYFFAMQKPLKEYEKEKMFEMISVKMMLTYKNMKIIILVIKKYIYII